MKSKVTFDDNVDVCLTMKPNMILLAIFLLQMYDILKSCVCKISVQCIHYYSGNKQ